MSASTRIFAVPVIVSVVILDQFSKSLAAKHIGPGAYVEIFPFFHLVNVKNTGAAFGLFRHFGNEFFIAFSVLAILVMAGYLLKGGAGFFALSLVFAGAVGNLMDRLFYGYVRDFIDLSVGRYHWPAFNVADAALTVGLFLLIFSSFFRKTA